MTSQTTPHALELAADALEAEAAKRRNAPYRHAYLLTATHYREEAKRLVAPAQPAA